MPTMTGRPRRTNVKTMDDVRRALQALEEQISIPTAVPAFIWVKVTDATVHDDNKWTYTGHQVTPSLSGGYLEFSTTDGGYEFEDTLFNSMEVLNPEFGGTTPNGGTRGNSVNADGDDYPEGFSLQPIKGDTGVIVLVKLEYLAEDDTTIGIMWQPNADDGLCAAAIENALDRLDHEGGLVASRLLVMDESGMGWN